MSDVYANSNNFEGFSYRNPKASELGGASLYFRGSEGAPSSLRPSDPLSNAQRAGQRFSGGSLGNQFQSKIENQSPSRSSNNMPFAEQRVSTGENGPVLQGRSRIESTLFSEPFSPGDSRQFKP